MKIHWTAEWPMLDSLNIWAVRLLYTVVRSLYSKVTYVPTTPVDDEAPYLPYRVRKGS
jgi:hypothetical protein